MQLEATGNEKGNSSNNGLPRYNHCSSGNVKIRIDYIFGNRTQCVKPGITTLDIPAGNRVKNAYYIGKC